MPSERPLQITELVPLAAILLEYPLAYVPISSDQTSFLAGVPLDVYECVLTCPSMLKAPEHILMKFSCPSVLAATNLELSVSRLEERLNARFAPRLKQAGLSGTFQIRHSTETLARVAL